MKKILILLSIFIVGFSYAFAKVPEGSSESKVKFCFDVSEAFGFSIFP